MRTRLSTLTTSSFGTRSLPETPSGIRANRSAIIRTMNEIRGAASPGLAGRVALVTGASRGVGRGIALGLGEAGATVYVTGRTVEEGTSAAGLPGTVHATAAEVTRLGGTGVAVPCDAGDDAQLAEVVAQVGAERGRLDVLVNSVWGGYERFTDGSEFNPGPFWDQPLELWDSMHRVGVRAHYVTTALRGAVDGGNWGRLGRLRLLVRRSGVRTTSALRGGPRRDRSAGPRHG